MVTVPAYALAFVVVVGGLPVLLPVVVALDLVRGSRFGATRLLSFAVVYLASELIGLAASIAGALVVRGERGIAWQRALQVAWARTLLGAARRLFGVRIVVDGGDGVGAGPLVILVRHVSIADTLLPTVVLSHGHGLGLRFVLKRELLWDPCLDVVGHRLPNAFVARGAVDGAREIARVRALATGVGPREGVLLYPEGTRFTPAKLDRALARLAARDPERHARVTCLTRVLPLQLGGTLAALDAMPEAAVLYFGHTGLEGATTLRDVAGGALVGRTVRIGLWREPASAIPRDRTARARWLDAQWGRMDAWVASTTAVDPVRAPAHHDLDEWLRRTTST